MNVSFTAILSSLLFSRSLCLFNRTNRTDYAMNKWMISAYAQILKSHHFFSWQSFYFVSIWLNTIEIKCLVKSFAAYCVDACANVWIAKKRRKIQWWSFIFARKGKKIRNCTNNIRRVSLRVRRWVKEPNQSE